MIRKTMLTLLAVILTLSFAACGNSTEGSTDNTSVNSVTTDNSDVVQSDSSDSSADADSDREESAQSSEVKITWMKADKLPILSEGADGLARAYPLQQIPLPIYGDKEGAVINATYSEESGWVVNYIIDLSGGLGDENSYKKVTEAYRGYFNWMSGTCEASEADGTNTDKLIAECGGYSGDIKIGMMGTTVKVDLKVKAK